MDLSYNQRILLQAEKQRAIHFVPPALVITVQPLPFTGKEGTNFSLTVVAPNAVKYEFFKGLLGSGVSVAVNSTGILPFPNALVSNNGNYYCVVRDEFSQVEISNVVNVTVETLTDLTKAVVTAAQVTESSVNISWGAVDHAASYVLLQASTGDMAGAVMVYSGTELTKAVTGLADKTDFYYQVKSLPQASYASSLSDVVHVTTLDSGAIAVPYTFKEGILQSINQNKYLVYGSDAELDVDTDNNRIAIITSGPTPKVWVRIKNMNIAYGHTIALPETYYPNNTGFTGQYLLDGSQDIASVGYKLIYGIKDGGGKKGSGLNRFYSDVNQNTNALIDVDSNPSLDLHGSVIRLLSDYNRPDIGKDFLVDGVSKNGDLNLLIVKGLGLQSTEVIPANLLNGIWKETRPLPWQQAPVKPAIIGNVRIGLIGDSNTFNFANDFQTYAQGIFPNANVTVLNTGRGGSYITHWVRDAAPFGGDAVNLYNTWIPQLKAAQVETVSIALGTNSGGSTATEFIQLLDLLLSQLREDLPAVQRFVIQQVPTVFEDQVVQDINAAINVYRNNTTVSGNGLLAFFHDYPEFLGDYKHPSETGRNLVMAPAWMRGIQQAMGV
ncbi:immunoglobulin domain-containing protein [Mucilaginibacter sp. CSA2-8R]|uniref:immunoglobulin domain-containing protein n=1 Tax=Mucilaginibacter sp. CSA2-8R TaxID=3141542 RepID=UPI00315CE90C